MDFSIKHISKAEFENSTSKVLFCNDMAERAFAECSFGSACFKFSWQSDLIEPSVLDLGKGIFCLGIDMWFVIVDSNTSEIILSLQLADFFKTINQQFEKLYVATDMEIIEINKNNYEVVRLIDLPDVFKGFRMSGMNLDVLCFDGSRINLGTITPLENS